MEACFLTRTQSQLSHAFQSKVRHTCYVIISFSDHNFQTENQARLSNASADHRIEYLKFSLSPEIWAIWLLSCYSTHWLPLHTQAWRCPPAVSQALGLRNEEEKRQLTYTGASCHVPGIFCPLSHLLPMTTI